MKRLMDISMKTIAAAMLAAVLLMPNAGHAQSDACAADFMDQIIQRATLEAQRETILNDVVIRKPDSVLEYTCFDQALKRVADYAGPIFSESQRWMGTDVSAPDGDITINVFMGNTHLDSALDALVMASLNSYVNANFAHNFLGGALGIENSIASTVSGAEASCTWMNDVFSLAKCNNFALDDQMLTFEELVTLDPRLLPEGLPGCANSNITQAMIDQAENKDLAYATLDPQESFIRFTTASSCEAPVPTGMVVTQKVYNIDLAGNLNITSTKVFDDHICINPGCSFDGSTSCVLNP